MNVTTTQTLACPNCGNNWCLYGLLNATFERHENGQITFVASDEVYANCVIECTECDWTGDVGELKPAEED